MKRSSVNMFLSSNFSIFLSFSPFSSCFPFLGSSSFILFFPSLSCFLMPLTHSSFLPSVLPPSLLPLLLFHFHAFLPFLHALLNSPSLPFLFRLISFLSSVLHPSFLPSSYYSSSSTFIHPFVFPSLLLVLLILPLLLSISVPFLHSMHTFFLPYFFCSSRFLYCRPYSSFLPSSLHSSSFFYSRP